MPTPTKIPGIMLVPFRTTRAPALLLEPVKAEDGITLVELLVALSLTVVVLGGILSMLITSQNIQARNDEWAAVLQEARTGLAAMTHDIRQAYSIKGTSESSIDFYAAIDGKSYEIEYKCNEPQGEDTAESVPLHECVRKEAAFEAGKPPTSLPTKGVPIIKDILNDSSEPVFKEYSPNDIAPDYVKIRLVVPAAGTLKIAGSKGYGHNVILSDGAYIRNMALGT